jgi:hypothetical protein
MGGEGSGRPLGSKGKQAPPYQRDVPPAPPVQPLTKVLNIQPIAVDRVEVVEKKQGRKYSQAEMIEALTVSRGLKSMAARHLGCPVQMVENYCKRWPKVQQVCKEQQEAFLDTAYLQCMSAVNRGEWKAIEFVLKTLGRNRGFSERTEITGKDGGPIEHAHIHLWEERLQQVHTEMAQRKAALLLERNADGTYRDPQETA